MVLAMKHLPVVMLISLAAVVGWTGCGPDEDAALKKQDDGKPIRVGVLHSLSGTIEIS
jgi:hypothetical protein